MKNRPFHIRFGYALNGVRTAWRTEASFRTQCSFGLGAVIALLSLRPSPVWWALVILTIAGVLAAELVNTALESMVDCLHPEVHPMIATAKDCAAGAVLVLSFASVLVFVAMMVDTLF